MSKYQQNADQKKHNPSQNPQRSPERNPSEQQHNEPRPNKEFNPQERNPHRK